MTLRRAARRDRVEREIVSVLRKAGFSVEFLSGDGVPDLLLGRCGTTLLAEVKSGNKPLRDSQRAWHEAWRGSTPIVLRSVDDALALVQRAMGE